MFDNNSDNNNHISLGIKPSFRIPNFINNNFRLVQFSLISIAPLILIGILFVLSRPTLQQKTILFQKPSQSSILLYSFLLCMCLLGLAMLGTEFFSWINSGADILLIHFKVYGDNIILGGFLVGANFFLLFCAVPFWTPCIFVKGNDCVGFTIICLTWFIYLCCCFTLEWVIMSSFATLLLTLAYPLHFTSLVMLHVSFVFVIPITFAIFVLDVILIWRDRNKISLCEKVSGSLAIIFFILNTFTLAVFLYQIIIRGYASTVVQRIVPAEGAVQGLYFLPSLILFVVGWMLKRNFFGMLALCNYMQCFFKL